MTPVLGDDAIERYARQIVIPGIGAVGQERLLASTAFVVGHPRGCAAATLYLGAAGVRVVFDVDATIDVVVVVDAAALDEAARIRAMQPGRPVCWSALDTDGILSGVHPDAPLPGAADRARPPDADALLDAAGCEVAALACRTLLGLAGGNESLIIA